MRFKIDDSIIHLKVDPVWVEMTIYKHCQCVGIRCAWPVTSGMKGSGGGRFWWIAFSTNRHDFLRGNAYPHTFHPPTQTG